MQAPLLKDAQLAKVELNRKGTISNQDYQQYSKIEKLANRPWNNMHWGNCCILFLGSNKVTGRLLQNKEFMGSLIKYAHAVLWFDGDRSAKLRSSILIDIVFYYLYCPGAIAWLKEYFELHPKAKLKINAHHKSTNFETFPEAYHLFCEQIGLAAPQPDGSTSLIRAVKKNAYESVMTNLRFKRTNINKQDSDGNTALMLALQKKNVAIIHKLLSYNAHNADIDPSLENSAHETLLEVAKKNQVLDRAEQDTINQMLKQLFKQKRERHLALARFIVYSCKQPCISLKTNCNFRNSELKIKSGFVEIPLNKAAFIFNNFNRLSLYILLWK